MQLLQAKLESTKFVCYICDQVLPQWDAVGSLEQGEKLQLVIFRHLAELSIHCGKLENVSVYVGQIFEKLKVLRVITSYLLNYMHDFTAIHAVAT